jgi:hypothetical protein
MLMIDYPEIGHCIINQSSKATKPSIPTYRETQHLMLMPKRDNYHIIFNNEIGYNKCCEIIECLANLGIINEEYVRIRQMRNDQTLRVSKTVCTDYVKPTPKFCEFVLNPYTKKEGNCLMQYMALLKSVNQLEA